MSPDAAMLAALAAVAGASVSGGSVAGASVSGSGGGGMFPPSVPVMPYDVLTPSQVAAYLQVGEDVVIQEAEAGRLPGQKLGGQWRFLRLAITEWLRAGQTSEPKSKSSKERML